MGDEAAAEAILTQAAQAYAQALGPRLRGAYALGSLAHGGYRPGISDIDLGLVLSERLRSLPNVTHDEHVSVFWGTGSGKDGRFPAHDRVDLLDHGRLLLGSDTREQDWRPSAQELLIEGSQFALDAFVTTRRFPRPRPGQGVIEICEPELLIAGGNQRTTKVVLFPVRSIFTAATGLVAGNAQAVSHYLTDQAAPARELVAAALAWRGQAPADEDATLVLVRRELIPLYLRYIDDYTERLQGAARPDLIARFTRWRTWLTEA